MIAVIGLGANLGDRARSLRVAIDRIAEIGEVRGESPLYETDPVGPPQPTYLNAAVLLSTAQGPEALMKRLLTIEAVMGRVRKDRNEPRVIDLDILWIEGISLATDTLVVPHPRLALRAFALGPLLDVAPHARDPVTQRRYAEMPLDRGALRRLELQRSSR